MESILKYFFAVADLGKVEYKDTKQTILLKSKMSRHPCSHGVCIDKCLEQNRDHGYKNDCSNHYQCKFLLPAEGLWLFGKVL